MSAFSTAFRVLTCPHCGAPIQVVPQGGQVQCGYCRSMLAAPARDDSALQQGGPMLNDAERMQGLWRQAQTFGDKPLPPEMSAVLAGGALTPDRVSGALGIWRSYCQRASAGDFVGGEHAVLITGSLNSYFAAVAKDPMRQRALFESTLDALRVAEQKQVIRCMLARLALKEGDMNSARTWFGACDPRSPDLQADTAYRVTYAVLATAANDFRNVLAALGPNAESIPVALPSRLQIDVIRANAIEKCGDVNTAVAQLVQAARTIGGAREAIPGIVATNPHLQLCPQSLRYAMAQF